MAYCVTVLPENKKLTAENGDILLTLLRSAGLSPEAPCGGNGRCGKCKVLVDGREVLACQSAIDRDMVVTVSPKKTGIFLSNGICAELSGNCGTALAVDIGTTTVVAYLIENGKVLAVESRKNPQAVFGADVVSRIQYALSGKSIELTDAIRQCVDAMTKDLLRKTGKVTLERVCVVGNPAMQQLFMGISVKNLTKIPFTPLLKETKISDGGQYVPSWAGAKFLTVPDIAGYIGADTVACVLATGMDKGDKLTLLVDIGTNGEMVLGNKNGLVACATAAGPALEGAGISCGMQAAAGAIDRVDQDFSCHIIGEGSAVGICGSGLVDAIAVALSRGWINERGRILNDSHTVALTDGVILTQEDIRQLQQAKGAIAAGIVLMTEHLGVSFSDIDTVYLAGAFGTYLDAGSACRIGLIPRELEAKIKPIGNAAGSGAMQIVCSDRAFAHTNAIVSAVNALELAILPDWARCFAQCMRFDNEVDFWCQKARDLGFFSAAPMDPAKLTTREDVRAMCAEDKCGAYGRNWTCPPHCGTLEKCAQKLRSYKYGLLLQTVGTMEKTIDTKAYRRTEQQHREKFCQFAERFRKVHPNALFLGAGGCRICDQCAYPEPCRFPEKACSSMEAYGLFVADVCRNNGLAYHHGEKTITYTACVLF